jgi:hypothetical protein
LSSPWLSSSPLSSPSEPPSSKKNWRQAAHGEVLELLSQPVDHEGETLQGRVLVRIMMRLDVEGLTNTFMISEGAPE